MDTATHFSNFNIGHNEHNDINERPKKRRRRNLVPQPQKPQDVADVIPSDIVSILLNRSIAKVCKSVGYTGANPCAQEALRKTVEEYYLHMLRTIGLFTHAHHRSRPTVIDFEEMCSRSHISLSSLEAELKRTRAEGESAYPLQPPSPPPPPDLDLTSLLGPQLDGSGDLRCQIYDHLPPFPSRHTYQATPVFAERPTEPRAIREKATAEARLAEQALRTLLAVSANKKQITTENDNRVGWLSRKERETIWESTLDELSYGRQSKVNGNFPSGNLLSLGEIMDGGGNSSIVDKKEEDSFLEVIVNSDSQFWRKGRVCTKTNNMR
ncbi:transcription factor TFIID complex subunit 8 C-term-domain-containing protein [Geopyxis carbonaria]|nr:transcription factor TFIID complex subunit 8 C-term-domain-containing protein [Geopyxis carbonaria]